MSAELPTPIPNRPATDICYLCGYRFVFIFNGKVVPDAGFEPATFGLQNRCTTTVLIRLPRRAFGSKDAERPAFRLRNLSRETFGIEGTGLLKCKGTHACSSDERVRLVVVRLEAQSDRRAAKSSKG
jgi:hypothetical protein